MSDPVDTDALRAWVDTKVTFEAIEDGWVVDAKDAIGDLCDEVDRLRKLIGAIAGRDANEESFDDLLAEVRG